MSCFFRLPAIRRNCVAVGENLYPLAHLCFSDLGVDSHYSPSYLQITIKASKTDPFRQGVTLFIGASGGTLCPVSAVLNYMVAWGRSPGQLFIWNDGWYLTREGLVARVRSALSAAGYREKDYAGHSFRIGAATTASRCGVQDSLIKTLGRWESTAYTRYIRTAPEVLCKVSKTLLQSLEHAPHTWCLYYNSNSSSCYCKS